MKKNGYTIYDILIIIAILGVSALIVIPSVSNALNSADNKDEVYSEIMENYLTIAEIYGNDKKEDIKEGNHTIISINDLIENGYLKSYSEDIIDIRDNITKMNNIKIKLTYDENEDKIHAEVN